MRPKYHFVATSLISLVFLYTTNSIFGALFVFIFGFFLDLDHLLDFWILQRKISFRNIKISDEFYKYRKVYVILHSYEVFLIFLLIGFNFLNDVTIGMMIGYFSHIFMDIVGNYLTKPLNPLFYSVIYRYVKKFDHFTLCPYKYHNKRPAKNK